METGLDIFLKDAHKRFRKQRLGILCNQASVTKQLRHVSELILEKKLGLTVSCFIGPQHGIRGEKQDNMVESDDFIDPRSGVPVFSLYGTSRVPTEPLLHKIDTFVIDLQDIGTRIYTFMYTMANCMRAAKEHNKKVVVLDRPNPIGGVAVEGNYLEPAFTSFVGQFPMVTRHGMTMGELALLFNEHFGIGCDLEIVKVKGWKREQYADKWGRDWVAPSPNIPQMQSALVFPGMVHFEGTNVSEGRGTTMPFEWVGAPFIEPDKLVARLNQHRIKGVYFRPIYFQPTFHKGKEQVCGGVQTHVTDRKSFNSYSAGIALLYSIAELHPAQFHWKQPPYEYEHERMPIDLIAGSASLRELVEGRGDLKAYLKQAESDTARFKKIRKDYLLYK